MSPRKPVSPKKSKSYDGKKIPLFCIKMRERRIELGITQEQLGKAVGIPKTRISEIELGRPPLSHDRIVKIAEALSCSIDWLFDYEVKEEPWPMVHPQVVEEIEKIVDSLDKYDGLHLNKKKPAYKWDSDKDALDDVHRVLQDFVSRWSPKI